MGSSSLSLWERAGGEGLGSLAHPFEALFLWERGQAVCPDSKGCVILS